jgi:23S rRNA pseudouridine1911/1915/1917 synthase
VSEPVTIPVTLAGTRVDRVVALFTGLSRAEVRLMVESGDVRLNGRPVTTPSRRVAAGDALEMDLALAATPRRHESPAPSASVPFTVLYEDPYLLVVDKPAGVVVHPGAGNRTDTLVSGLLSRYPDLAALGASGGDPDRPGIVHRLDKDTSGVLVVARTGEALTSLTSQLAARTARREYIALACGLVIADEGLIDAPLGRSGRDPTLRAVSAAGRPARTRYHVRRRYRVPTEVTELQLGLETGRTHQIRVHMSAIGHPVLGDARYGGRRKDLPLGRPFLHAWRLALVHPATGETMEWTAPLPADLQQLLDGLQAA